MRPLRERRLIATGFAGWLAVLVCVGGVSSVSATVQSSATPPAPAPSADPQAPATPTPDICPGALLLQSTNGTDYTVVFSSNVAQTVSFSLTLYSKDATYSVVLPAVSMTTDAAGIGRKGFRSTAIDLRKPAGSEIVAARIQASTPTQTCEVQHMSDIPSSTSLQDPKRALDTTEKQLEVAAASEIANGAKPIDLDPTPKSYACSKPFAQSHTVALVSPPYPYSAQLAGITGTTVIEISISDQNSVEAASIYKSSGEPDLDRAAFIAAIATTYMSEVFDCHRVPGKYLFRADFAGR